MDNDEEEACTPRADEATPLHGEKPPRRRSLVIGACATLAQKVMDPRGASPWVKAWNAIPKI